MKVKFYRLEWSSPLRLLKMPNVIVLSHCTFTEHLSDFFNKVL